MSSNPIPSIPNPLIAPWCYIRLRCVILAHPDCPWNQYVKFIPKCWFMLFGEYFLIFLRKFFTAKILVISKKDTWEVSILFLSCSHICHIFHLLCTIYYIFGWNNIDLKCGFAFTARNVKQVVGFLSEMDPTKSCQCAKLNYFRIKIGVLQNFCNSPGLCWVQSGRFYTRWFN